MWSDAFGNYYSQKPRASIAIWKVCARPESFCAYDKNIGIQNILTNLFLPLVKVLNCQMKTGPCNLHGKFVLLSEF